MKTIKKIVDKLVRPSWYVRKSDQKQVKYVVAHSEFENESEYIRYLINQDRKNHA